MILLVASNKDIASQNIAGQILKMRIFKEVPGDFQGNPVYEADINHRKARLITLNEESVYSQDLASQFGSLELVVFISRHSSESRTPTLSTHTPGNLGDAKLGGLPRKVSFSPASAMRTALGAMMRLKKERGLSYEVSYEATHHGPSLDVPTMFVELGSSIEQWNDVAAADVVARAATEAISKFGRRSAKVSLGIGGPHYNMKFTKIALEEEIAFGHIIPKYAVSSIDATILRHCIERTLEKVDSIILDWKGITGEDKPHIVRILGEIGFPFEKA